MTCTAYATLDTPRKRLKWLRVQLHHQHTMTKIDIGDVRAGFAAAKRLGAQMRECQKAIAEGKKK
jgi:hypothetical protein